MTTYEIIAKKKQGGELSQEEIQQVVDGYVTGDIPDYQMSALLMAICLRSMSDRETADLTMSMAHSGEMMKPDTGGFNVDKHSTGGVGDKTTLIAAPIAASCGVYVPKMSGRGLGHTGGTIDKLESIPGFRTELSYERFTDILRKNGLAVAGQSGSLVPADKKIYALRNATATVDSIPLICSSIMSKKIATGADGIVLDVKVGDGAFMKTAEDAEKLAELMVRAGRLAGRKCSALLTDMSKPLGHSVGNSLEVIEAIEALKGNAPKDLWEVSLALASEMISIAGLGTAEECRVMAEKAVASGKALERLSKMIELQGGDPGVIDDYGLFASPKKKKEIFADRDGFITGISCEKTGLISLSLGAGRSKKEDDVDSSAGIVFDRTVGDEVCKGDRLAVLYTSSECDLEGIAADFAGVFRFGDKTECPEEKNIIKIIKGY
ncbi:MAG: thymidine phosphorylase [Oscillospiraceae bacterium]|nr:thymidine phosphorylase [Oscillospiraceae bacterium]